MRERVGREDRVVEDHRLGLAAEEAGRHLRPELGRVLTRTITPQPVEPSVGLDAMAELEVSHGEEGPIRRQALPTEDLDGLIEPADRLIEPSGTVQRGAERAQTIALVGRVRALDGRLGQMDQDFRVDVGVRRQDASPDHAEGRRGVARPAEASEEFGVRPPPIGPVAGGQEGQGLPLAEGQAIGLEPDGDGEGRGGLLGPAARTPGSEPAPDRARALDGLAWRASA